MDSKSLTRECIKEVFNFIQESSSCHLKYSIILKKALENDNKNLQSEFDQCLQKVLCTNYKGKNNDLRRVINFLILFCNSLKSKNQSGDEHPLLYHILELLLNHSDVDNDSCRYWSCHLIQKIIEKWEDLPEDLYDSIKTAMLNRLKDSKADLRVQAVISLTPFQDCTDPEDAVIERFHTLLESDINARVRQACVENIAPNKLTLPSILNRCRDVEANVRSAAFKKISPLALYLKLNQRRDILWSGFLDSSENVKKIICEQLLEDWLKSYSDDFLLLMKAIRLDACEEDIKRTVFLTENMLITLFKFKTISGIISPIKLNHQKFLDYNDLNWETILYYRIVIEYFRQSEEFDETLATILPELVDFCNYIRGYYNYVKTKASYDEMEVNFILKQLFCITKDYDFGDATSRHHVNCLAQFMLQNVNLTVEVAEMIMSNLEKTIQKPLERSIFVCEIISNIIDGNEDIDYEEFHQDEIKRKEQISQIKSEIATLYENELECNVQCLYDEAKAILSQINEKQQLLEKLENVQTINEDLIEKKLDVSTVLRYLTVAEALLKSPTIKNSNPALATLISKVIQKDLIHEDINIKLKAFTCYAIYCVLDPNSAKYGIHLFSAPILSDDFIDDKHVHILKVCINAVVDLLSLYGLSLISSLIENQDNENVDLSESRRESQQKVFAGGTSLEDLIMGLENLVDHEHPDIETAAIEGICVLLVSGHLSSSSLLSRAIIKWANPATENPRIKQSIGYFLNSLSQTSCLNYLGDAMISTIRTIVYAPSSSPLSDIDIDEIIKFLMVFSQMNARTPEIHTDVAFKICNQMMDKPRVKVNYAFSKVLSVLNVSNNIDQINELLDISSKLLEVIRNNQLLRCINKFRTNLQKLQKNMNLIKNNNAIIVS